MRALFIVSDKGNGHKVRCGALADELRRRGWEFYDAATPHNMMSSHVVILDDPSAADIMCERLVVIVDSPSQKRYADLLVCGSAGATTEMFADSVTKRVLAGPQFALLRRGFDSGMQWDRTVIKTDRVCDARNVDGLSAEGMVAAYATALVTITYGGMRAMEAAAIGAPMVIEARNEGEELNAAGLVAMGAAFWPGKRKAFPQDFDLEGAIQAQAEAIASSLSCQDAMTRRGRENGIDGMGTLRVADAIEEMFA